MPQRRLRSAFAIYKYEIIKNLPQSSQRGKESKMKNYQMDKPIKMDRTIFSTRSLKINNDYKK